MAPTSRPSSGQNPQDQDRISSTAASEPAPEDQIHRSPTGFSTLELGDLASNPLLEGILGPNKDGRVRNPVPSKLKGKTDNKKGNFGVMHMGTSPGGKKGDGPGRDAAAERDAAARRTSENTASRAKAAQLEKYVPPKKRVSEATPIANHGSPFGAGREEHRQRARPLTPDETKYEQARLLTTLRSINPITVVDQICKAIAYFGGIPGAPPPEDGIFPESANTKETGALFIGWIAEIFPDLQSPEVTRFQELPASAEKRGRGRPPKGVLGHGDKASSKEPPNPRNGFGYGPAISPPTWAYHQPLPLARAVSSSVAPEAVGVNNTATPLEKQPPSTPIKPQSDGLQPENTSTNKRGRGRPKGSKNKGKNDLQPLMDGSISNSAVRETHGEQPSQANEIVAGQHPELPTFVPDMGAQANTTKQTQEHQYSELAWQGNATNHRINQQPNVAAMDELSPEERAVLQVFRSQGSQAVITPVSGEKQAAGTPGSGVKRKRAPPKLKAEAEKPNGTPVQTKQQDSSSLTAPQQVSDMGKETSPWTSVDNPRTTSRPPAKRPRQRKQKVTGPSDTPAGNQTSGVSNAQSPAQSTIPDSTAASSQQSLPVSRAPAEGLEAHYERFTNLAHQNGRSHTPAMTPQQQLRHQQKTSSVPPQQPPQQVQLQRQKSQQSNQREESKMARGSSARSSSGSTSSFYQRSQGSSYNPQYPSHQPTQLYGTHQPSPQMSTSSYRTGSTNTLAQASPQFSHAESTYRTTSPHTISQTSPSFSHPDNASYRASSSHSLAQPSPSFSQAETSYRAASTHSVGQPSSAYTSRQQSQPQSSHTSHYNHFPDPSYIDLPTLESLGHGGTSGNTSVSMSTGQYGQGQGIGVGVGATRGGAGSSNLYGSSSMSNAFDTGTNNLLRTSRAGTGSNTAYSTTSGLGNFSTGTSDHDMREHLLRDLSRR